MVVALGIAICAAAPELIWRGAKIALTHASWADLVSILLIGGIIAFFVEPILERTRRILEWARSGQPFVWRTHALFTAFVSMVFALTSVSVHDVMLALVSGDDLDRANGAGLSAVLVLTLEWAIVPFAVALAWQTAQSRRLAMPLGIVAAFSSGLAGWLFGWSMRTVIATAIPCLIIQYFGYRQMKGRPAQDLIVPHAAVVAGSAIGWLIAASLFDAAASFFDLHSIRLYDTSRLLIDLRFYFGWVVGLLLAGSTQSK